MLRGVLIALGGLAVGASLGLLGGGGTILTLPLLLALGVEAKQAIASSLAVVAATACAAALPHARAGNVDWRAAALFGPATALGGFSAGHVAGRIRGETLLLVFTALMIAAGSRCCAGGPPRRRLGPGARRAAAVLALQGAAIGALTGLVGAGGGFLFVPAFALLAGMPMARAVGTSLVVIAASALAALAGHLARRAPPRRGGSADRGGDGRRLARREARAPRVRSLAAASVRRVRARRRGLDARPQRLPARALSDPRSHGSLGGVRVSSACRAPRGRWRRRTRGSRRRRRARRRGSSSSTRLVSAREEAPVVGDEQHGALEAGERARSASPWSPGRGGWSARRAPEGWAGRRACAPARGAPSRRPTGAGSASRCRRPEKPKQPASVRSEPIEAAGKACLERLEDGLVAVEHLHRVLREVAELHGRAERDAAAVGRRLAGDQLEQRGLAGAVHAHHAPALAGGGPADRGRRRRRARRRPCAARRCAPRRRPSAAPGGTRSATVWRRFGGSTFSIFSSFLTRDCTCAAWLARALKRAMKASSLASIACWRAYCAACSRSAIARWRS